MWQLLNSISSKSGSLTATTARTVTTPFDLCAAKSLIPRSTLGCKKKPAPREHLRDVSFGGSHWWCVFHSTSLNPLLGCTASVSLATSFHWKWHEFKLTAGTIFYQTANFFSQQPSESGTGGEGVKIKQRGNNEYLVSQLNFWLHFYITNSFQFYTNQNQVKSEKTVKIKDERI